MATATVPRSPKRNKARAQTKQQKATSDSSPPFFAPIPQPPRSDHLKAQGDASQEPRVKPNKGEASPYGLPTARWRRAHRGLPQRLAVSPQQQPPSGSTKGTKKEGDAHAPHPANIKLKYCILINFLRAEGATAMPARMGFLPRRGKQADKAETAISHQKVVSLTTNLVVAVPISVFMPSSRAL